MALHKMVLFHICEGAKSKNTVVSGDQSIYDLLSHNIHIKEDLKNHILLDTCFGDRRWRISRFGSYRKIIGKGIQRATVGSTLVWYRIHLSP